ncbi:hypothetical protein Vretifemale_8725 [Volvox reticuliferus]|uniref:Uncharacterized protein n=1 Tax=Volvox reticuliferus TaxID=1737510 RepID=A0A8J4FNH1_9CHLO|nr:hypothetical protein Vretifemale_8725 [Volvox reticuliferus]
MLMVFRAYLRMSEFPFSSNALYKARTHFAVELHPSTVENVTEGVKDQLNANLLRYVEEFEGVLLSYSNLEILTKKVRRDRRVFCIIPPPSPPTVMIYLIY